MKLLWMHGAGEAVDKPIVFVSAVTLAQEVCKHPIYEMDDEGYWCPVCGVALVFCWKCMIAAVMHHTPGNPHIHIFPEHEDYAARACIKSLGMTSNRKTGLA